MNQWFGPKPFGRICDDLPHAVTPVGVECFYCHEGIEDGDSGIIMPVLMSDDWQMKPEHHECFLRSIFGSVAHIERRCSCHQHGSPCGDPIGMSKREAARASVIAWKKARKLRYITGNVN